MICPKCGKNNLDGATFCYNCGASLTENVPTNETPIETDSNVSTENVNNVSEINTTNVVEPHNNSTTTNISANTKSSSEKKNSKQFLVIIIVIIAIALLGFGIFSITKNFTNKSPEMSKSDLEEIFNPDIIIVQNKGKYGYIKSNGDILIEPKYEEASAFNGDYAIVKVEKEEPSYYYWDKYEYQLIDKSGEVKFTVSSDSGIKYYSKYNVWLIDGKLYNEKLTQISPDNYSLSYLYEKYFKFSIYEGSNITYGIMDISGKVLYTIDKSVYFEVSQNKNDLDDIYVEVKDYTNKEYIIVSLKTGKVVYELKTASVNDLYANSNGIFYHHGEKSYSYYDRIYLYFYDGKLAYQTKEKGEEITLANYEKQILKVDYGWNYDDLGKDRRYYYYDVKNAKFLDIKSLDELDINLEEDVLEDLFEKTYGFTVVTNTSNKKCIISDKKVLIPCKYDDIDYFKENLHTYLNYNKKQLVLLKKDDKYALCSVNNGKELYAFDSDEVKTYDNSTFISARINKTDEKYDVVIYNLLSGESVIYENISTSSNPWNVYSNYITYENDGKITYYNTKFEPIYVGELK